MITVTNIFNDKGQKIGEVAKCDCKPWWNWIDFAIGILGALVAISIIVMV